MPEFRKIGVQVFESYLEASLHYVKLYSPNNGWREETMNSETKEENNICIIADWLKIDKQLLGEDLVPYNKTD